MHVHRYGYFNISVYVHVPKTTESIVAAIIPRVSRNMSATGLRKRGQHTYSSSLTGLMVPGPQQQNVQRQVTS